MKKSLKIKLLSKTAVMPRYATEGAAGADLCADIAEDVVIAPGERALVPTGIAVALPDNSCVALIYARSGLAVKHGITLSNCVGVIDSDYRGEIKVGLINQSDSEYTIKPGERIAQMVIAPVLLLKLERTEELDDTVRGAGGFGSTGKL